MRKLLVYHLPAALYAVGIIVVSSIPDLKAPPVALLPIPLDKVVHFLEYAIFTLLAVRSFYHISPAISRRNAGLISLLFLTGFAALDEYHQGFIAGRSPDITDLLYDILGAAFVLVWLWLRNRRRMS